MHIALQQAWVFLFGIILASACFPTVAAINPEQNFPEITFQDFSDFILQNFNSKISLSTVLMMLFTLTNNIELLSLHAKDQTSSHSSMSGWMNCLVYTIFDTLGDDASKFFL